MHENCCVMMKTVHFGWNFVGLITATLNGNRMITRFFPDVGVSGRVQKK